MKKTFLKSAVIAIVGVGLMAGSAFALPANSALQDALDARTQGGASSVNVYNDMLNDNYDSAWGITATGGSVAAIMFEFAAYAGGNNFGIFDLNNPTNTLQLFAGTDSAGVLNGGQVTLSVAELSGTVYFAINNDWTNKVAFSSSNFGYYLDVTDTGNTYYSNTDLNSDSYDHMFAYQGVGDQFSIYNAGNYATWTSSEYILAWEDLYNGGDQDFTDFVVMVESVEPVPEPATMLLFGTGLAGLAGVARRRKAKES